MLDFLVFLFVFVVLIRLIAVVVMMWKVSDGGILPYLLLLGFLLFLASCSKDDINLSPCIDGSCDALFEIDKKVSPNAYKDSNGYWHIPHEGLNYFTIKGKLDELLPEYIINKVPLIETRFDSDYWLQINNIKHNIVGYQVNKNQCMDCPYSPTLIGTYSKYTYKPKQQIFFMKQMIGDTAKISVKTTFNSDLGIREIVKKEFKVIFE